MGKLPKSYSVPSVHGATETEALSDDERNRLEENEKKIGEVLLSFIDIGEALYEIRESRLYREGFDTFEDYSRKRWNFSRQRAYQLIEAAKVADYLSTCVAVMPTTEAQVRPLTRLSMNDARAVWKLAEKKAERKDVTVALVKLAVAELQGHEHPVRNDFDRKLSAFERGCEQIQKFADETAYSGWTECRKERLGKAIGKVLSVAMNLGILDDHGSSS